MGFEVDAWYGSSWSAPPSAPIEPETDFSAREESSEGWRVQVRKLMPPPGPNRREGGALVLGRFYPPHLGHAFLIQTAEWAVKGEVISCVFGRTEDRLSLEKRFQIVFDLHTRGRTRAIMARDVVVPGSPEQPDFWTAWATWVRGNVPLSEIRTLFASDPRAEEVARRLKLDFVLVDPERRAVPISATMIRKDPWTHWRFIHPDARSAFACSVVLLGPEGAGKTLLSKALARHYATTRAPEYIEDWVRANQGKTPAPGDFEALARGQRERLDTARAKARKFFVADTDLLSLRLWQRRLHGVDDASLVTPGHVGDLYLVLDDAPWSGAADRDQPEARRGFVRDCLDAVRALGRTPVLLSGPRESRAAAAMEAIAAWERTNPAAWEP